MSGKRYTEEFKIEAVKHVTDRGYIANGVAKRPGVTSKSVYGWIKKYSDLGSRRQALNSQQNEFRRRKADESASFVTKA